MEKEIRKSREGLFSLKSIRRRLEWSFGILILIILVMASLAYTLNVAVWSDANSVRTINAPLTLMAEQVIGYDAMLTGDAHAALLHSLKGDSAGVAEYKAKYDATGTLLDNLLKTEAWALIIQSRRSLEDKQLVYGYLSQLDEINLKLVDLETRAFAAMQKGNNDEAYSLIVGETYHEYKIVLADLYHKWSDEEQKIAEYYRQRALTHNIQVRYINLSLAIILILALIIIPISIFKSVVKPIDKLTDIVEDISSGNIDAKMSNNLKKNKGEIGKLANSFERLHESSHFALKTLVESKMEKRESAVTEREKELELREEMNKEYRTLFENNVEAIFVADSKTRKLVDCNKAAEKLLGYSKKEILSMKADELHPKDKIKETMGGFEKQAKGLIKSLSTEVLTKDKKRIPVKINASAVKIGNKTYSQGIFIKVN